MAATPLLWLSPSEVPPLPAGWRALPTEQVVEALKPGPLYENKTVQKAGAVPVVSQSGTEFLGYHNNAPGVVASPHAPVVTFTNHTCALRLMKQPFSCIQNVFPKVGKPGVCDTTFFYYAAQSRVVLTDYKGHHPLFRQAHIPVPPLPIQHRIASILSSYDDLIENNRKRIAILEDMARRLYREWFVHFRYPGHEAVPLVDSPLGRIPQGWDVRTIGSLCDRVTDGAHLSPKSVDAGLPMASSKDMHAFGLDLSSARHIAPDDYAQLERQGCRPLKYDVLITKDGANYCKNVFVQMKDEEVVLLSSVAILRPRKDVSSFYLSESLKSRETKDRLKLRVSGAAIPRIILADFKQFPLVFPTSELVRSWDQRVTPMITLCVNLVDQISVLRRTRDLLLPRLMSGTLSVEALATAEAAAP